MHDGTHSFWVAMYMTGTAMSSVIVGARGWANCGKVVVCGLVCYETVESCFQLLQSPPCRHMPQWSSTAVARNLISNTPSSAQLADCYKAHLRVFEQVILSVSDGCKFGHGQ